MGTTSRSSGPLQGIADPLGLFGAPGVQLPPAAPPLPQRDDKDVLAAREKARLAALRRRGRAATILSKRSDALGAAPVSRPGLNSRLGGGDA